MPLIQGSPVLHMLNQFRVAWVMGGYGSGKTSGAIYIAHELYKTGKYRYILGNFNSVWTDSPEKVILRDGAFVDAVVILDEGGLFMRLSRDADSFLLGLRKLNITILVPSVLPPAQRIKGLQFQRILNLQAFGLPMWVYENRLYIGSEKERSIYGWWNPGEVFGVYDTMDYPVDDCYLGLWFDYWMSTARSSRPKWVTWGPPPGYDENGRIGETGKRNRRSTGQDSGVAELRGIIEEVYESQEGLSESVSLSTFGGSNQGRKRRR